MTFVPRYLIGALDLTEYPFAVLQDEDRGNPENVADVVDSMLQDGEIVSSFRSGNRTMAYTVYIEGADLAACADAEARLIEECDKQRNTFTIEPGDGFGETTVFDIFRVQARFVYDADAEQQGLRRYDLTIQALPFGRSDSEVVDAALVSGVTPTTVTVADGTSTSGWSGTSTVTSSGGVLQQSRPTTSDSIGTGTYYQADAAFTYTPGAAINFSATPYLSVDYLPIYQGTVQQTTIGATVDGLSLPQVSNVLIANGWRRVTWLTNDSSATVVAFQLASSNYFPTGSGPSPLVTYRIDNVTRSNQAPNTSSTGRQSLRTVSVTGSARTQASLSVQHETAGLGEVLVYTCPALETGYQPDLRRWRTSGGTVTADATTVSGSRESNTSSIVFNVPAAGMPRGSYVLMARVRSDSGAVTRDIPWSVATKIGSAAFGTQSGTSAKFALTTSVWQIVPVGVVTLPPTDVSASSAGTVQVTLSTGGGNVEYDEAWLFYVGEDAALTQVSCGAGSPAVGTVHNRLWLDNASLDRFEPSAWVGVQSDRSDAFHIGDRAAAWGVHSFAPPQMNVFVVTTGAANPAVSLRHFPRWFTHAVAS